MRAWLVVPRWKSIIFNLPGIKTKFVITIHIQTRSHIGKENKQLVEGGGITTENTRSAGIKGRVPEKT